MLAWEERGRRGRRSCLSPFGLVTMGMRDPPHVKYHEFAINLQMCDALARCFGRSLSRHKPPPEDASTLSDGYLRDLRDLFLHHLLQLHCNSHSVTTTTTKHGGGGGVDVMGEVVLGTALYCHASLFNHSCFPNAICRYPRCTAGCICTPGHVPHVPSTYMYILPF